MGHLGPEANSFITKAASASTWQHMIFGQCRSFGGKTITVREGNAMCISASPKIGVKELDFLIVDSLISLIFISLLI